MGHLISACGRCCTQYSAGRHQKHQIKPFYYRLELRVIPVLELIQTKPWWRKAILPFQELCPSLYRFQQVYLTEKPSQLLSAEFVFFR